MKQYVLEGKIATRDVWLNGSWLNPKPSQELCNHSPDGYAWGYGGSGPAQLALAVLLVIKGAEYALSHHQDFKWAFIAMLPKDKDFRLEFEL
jgi:hypothetical protein